MGTPADRACYQQTRILLAYTIITSTPPGYITATTNAYLTIYLRHSRVSHFQQSGRRSDEALSNFDSTISFSRAVMSELGLISSRLGAVQLFKRLYAKGIHKN